MSVLTGSFNTGDHSVTDAARQRRFGPIYSRNVRAVVARGLMATKSSNWMVMVSGFFEPVLYLISMGVGLGAIVGLRPGPGRAGDQLRRLHRAGAAGGVRHERRRL